MTSELAGRSGDAAAAARRSMLLGVKLRALVADHIGLDDLGEPTEFAPGAALIRDRSGWVLLDDRPQRRLGAALAWAVRAGVSDLNVIADSDAGLLARRASQFEMPVSVWHADGRELVPAKAEPSVEPRPVLDAHLRFAPIIEAAGATLVVEHGVVAGEVCGLEVCRVVDDPAVGVTRLEVGVGAHDRQAFAMLHGDEPTADALARIVAAVAVHRRPDADPHPLNRLAAERMLRWRLLGDPNAVDAGELWPAAPPVPRQNLKDPVPCVAVGRTLDGVALVVVCSVGVDLDLVPYAADARLSAAMIDAEVDEQSRLVVVTPGRDRLPVTIELASLLRHPARLVSLD